MSDVNDSVSYMRKPLTSSLTIRLDADSIRVLRARARAERRSTSAVVRELIQEKVRAEDKAPTFYEMSKKWVGAAPSGTPNSRGRDARKLLASWNPDRRG